MANMTDRTEVEVELDTIVDIIATILNVSAPGTIQYDILDKVLSQLDEVDAMILDADQREEVWQDGYVAGVKDTRKAILEYGGKT